MRHSGVRGRGHLHRARLSALRRGTAQGLEGGHHRAHGNAVYYTKANTTSQVTIGTRTTGGSSFGIKNSGSSTHLIIEATGYYVPPLSARISPTGAVIDQSGRLQDAYRADTGYYILTWDRDIDFCTGVGSADAGAFTVAVWTTGNMAYVYVYNPSGVAANYYANVLITC